MKVLFIEARGCWVGLNIALGYLIASLKKNGMEAYILDMANHRNWPEELMEKKFIEYYKPDLIGIPLFYNDYYTVKEMVKRIKKYSTCPIIVGGPQMLIEKEQIMIDMPGLDYALIGDGEHAIVELCKAINGEMGFNEIDGLIYRNNGEIVKNRARKVNKYIDNLPFPDYEPFGVKKIKFYQILTSRGCPFNCTYCFRSSPYWRPRNPEDIIAELLTAIDKYQIDEFIIVDDSFNIRPDRIVRFCDLLDENKISLPWSCTGVRIDRITESFAKRIREAGCYSVSIGIETLDPDLYDQLNRGMSIESVLRGIKILKKCNFEIDGYLMMGLPGETKEKTFEVYKKASKLGLSDFRFSILLPISKTKMYDMVYSNPNVKKVEDYKRISSVWMNSPEFSRVKTAFETPEYPAHEKIEMYNKLRTMTGDPRPPYHKSLIIFGLHAFFWVFKYDFSHAPLTLYKLSKSFLKRFISAKGRGVSKVVIEYKPSFMRKMKLILTK